MLLLTQPMMRMSFYASLKMEKHMANEFLMPGFVLNTLEGAVFDLNDVRMQRWPDQPTGRATSRDQMPPRARDGQARGI